MVTAYCDVVQDDHTNIEAKVAFDQCIEPPEDVHIGGQVSGLAKGLHGFHIHVYGFANITQDCKNAGPHFNPFDVSNTIMLKSSLKS